MKALFIKPVGDRRDSGIYEFLKTTEIEKKEKYTINIFASTRYILYINDEYICEGPCRGKSDVRYYDTVDVVLNEGVNTIRVKVMHIAKREQFTSAFKTEIPVLIFNAKSDNNSISSDDTWMCEHKKGHKLFRAKGYADFIPPSEEIDVTIPNELIKVEQWEGMEHDFSCETTARWGCIPNDIFLQPRPIPLIIPDKVVDFKVVKKGEDFVEFDAGEYVCAKVSIDIAPFSDVKIIYSECYTLSDGVSKRRRDDSSGILNGLIDLIHTSDKEYTFNTYWFKAFRYIRIETKNPDEVIKNITAKRCNYPLKIESQFNCSDEYLNKMHKISINTMLCCMHETFVDCPHYELLQYQMDTSIEANVSMRMSNDLRLVKKSIDDLAASQVSSGLLRANYPNVFVQIIPGFSFFWIFLLRDYLDYSKDTEFVYNYLGVMDKILNYFDNEIRKHGYITTSCYWDYVDAVKEWGGGVGIPLIEKGDILTIYNIYYLCALKNAAYICRNLGKNHYADEYEERYNTFKNIVNELCFDGELYTDGHKDKSHSVHTIIWAILSELVSGDDAKRMIAHINDEDINKPSFSMMYYVFRAIEKCGMYDMVEGMFGGWKQMIDYNCTTWCENFAEDGRSECHAWSSAPLYECMVNILGVKCSFDDVIVINPKPLHLTFAEGTVPTRFGNVNVKWDIKDGQFKINIKAPEGVKKILITPDNKEYVFEGSEFEIN